MGNPDKKKLLIVDDEPVVRQVFRLLMGKDCEVIEVGAAEEAIARLEKESVDLIVTDKNLPGLNGIELARAARRLDPDSKVILLTAYPSLLSANDALELGVLDYLLKPLDDTQKIRDKLLAALGATPARTFKAANRRIDLYEDDGAAAEKLAEGLTSLGLEPKVLTTPEAYGTTPPAGVVVSWAFRAAPAERAIELAKVVSRGAPFVVLADQPTLDITISCIREIGRAHV